MENIRAILASSWEKWNERIFMTSSHILNSFSSFIAWNWCKYLCLGWADVNNLDKMYTSMKMIERMFLIISWEFYCCIWCFNVSLIGLSMTEAQAFRSTVCADFSATLFFSIRCKWYSCTEIFSRAAMKDQWGE